jgi:hypothetical protein
MFACRYGNEGLIMPAPSCSSTSLLHGITNMTTEPEKKPLEPTPTQPGDAVPDGGGHNEPPKQVLTPAKRL